MHSTQSHHINLSSTHMFYLISTCLRERRPSVVTIEVISTRHIGLRSAADGSAQVAVAITLQRVSLKWRRILASSSSSRRCNRSTAAPRFITSSSASVNADAWVFGQLAPSLAPSRRRASSNGAPPRCVRRRRPTCAGAQKKVSTFVTL